MASALAASSFAGASLRAAVPTAGKVHSFPQCIAVSCRAANLRPFAGAAPPRPCSTSTAPWHPINRAIQYQNYQNDVAAGLSWSIRHVAMIFFLEVG